MNRIARVLLSIFLNACASVGVCDYPFAEKGWYSVSKPPSEIVDEFNVQSFWFADEKGNFLACGNLVGKKHCGNIYQIFSKQSNGGFREEEIVCMQ